jgi:hypothetical protein
MSKDPEQCSVTKKDGARCPNKPMYKIGRSGFCEEHRSLAVARSQKAAGKPATFDPEVSR